MNDKRRRPEQQSILYAELRTRQQITSKNSNSTNIIFRLKLKNDKHENL